MENKKCKHTEGPWVHGAGYGSLKDGYGSIYSQGERVAYDYIGGKEIAQVVGNISLNLEARANARLICSAPEMLEMLEVSLAQLQRELDNCDSDSERYAELFPIINHIKGVISRAKGE